MYAEQATEIEKFKTAFATAVNQWRSGNFDLDVEQPDGQDPAALGRWAAREALNGWLQEAERWSRLFGMTRYDAERFVLEMMAEADRPRGV